jgi:chromosome segregation ATPase
MTVAKNQGLSRKYHRCYDGLATRGKGLLMTSEERDRAMNFVIDSLAGLVANGEKQNARLDKLIASHEKAEHRLDRYDRILRLMIRAGRRERSTRSQADERLTKALAELADSQAHTDSQLDALVDIVRQRLNGGQLPTS